MEKKKLLSLALKLGIKKENFELGFNSNKESMEKTILEAAKYMGVE